MPQRNLLMLLRWEAEWTELTHGKRPNSDPATNLERQRQVAISGATSTEHSGKLSCINLRIIQRKSNMFPKPVTQNGPCFFSSSVSDFLVSIQSSCDAFLSSKLELSHLLSAFESLFKRGNWLIWKLWINRLSSHLGIWLLSHLWSLNSFWLSWYLWRHDMSN